MDGIPIPMIAPYLPPSDVDVVVVEEDGKIVAAWTVMNVVHLEGVWVDPEHRRAGVVRSLIRTALAKARDRGQHWAFTGANDDHTRDIITRMGGKLVPMETWVLPLGEVTCQQQ